MRPMPRSEQLRARRPVPVLRHGQSGFTLIEAVLVTVLTGILIATVSVFIVPSVQAYLATAARAQLVDQADTALRRIGRDLALALPNSVRTLTVGNVSVLELIPSTGAARYASEGANQPRFGYDPSLVAGFEFALIGPPLQLGAAQQLVFYNLGPAVPDANAYAPNASTAEQIVSNRRSASNGAGPASKITVAATVGLPIATFAAPYRVYAVGSPISYRCDLAAGTLTRYQGYGFSAVQPNPPTGGSTALLATGVSACQFDYEVAVVAARAALVTLRLGLSGNTATGSETVTLYHALHVDNLP